MMSHEERMQLGNRLYARVHAINAHDASKITGMFLELTVEEVHVLMDDENHLRKRIDDALHVLQTAQISRSYWISQLDGKKTFSLGATFPNSQDAVQALADVVRKNSTLQELHLNHESFAMDSAAAIAFAGALKENKTLRCLNFENNKIDSAGAKALAEALMMNCTLQTLDLGKNQIDCVGAAELAGALKKNGTLQNLHLEDNKIGVTGIEMLAASLKENDSLKRLDLGENQITSPGATALADALKVNSTIEVLHLSNNRIDSEGATALAESLERNSSLRELYLRRNSIGSEGAIHIMTSLQKNSTLKKLFLCKNRISRGAEAAAITLRGQGCKLQELGLSSTCFDSTGTDALAKSLKTNTSLRRLDLASSNIGITTMKLFAESLKENRYLKLLNLKNNQIGSEGVRELAQVLELNSTLEVLTLCDSSIDSVSIQILSKSLKTNSTLRQLYLQRNKIDSEGAKALLEALEKNSTLLRLDLSENQIDSSLTLQLGHCLTRNVEISKFVKENSLSKDQERFLHDELRDNNILSMMKEGYASTVASYIMQKHVLVNSSRAEILGSPNVDVTRQSFPQNREVFEMLCQNLLTKKQEISTSLREFSSHCDQWTSLRVQKALPSSHETFENEFSSSVSSVLSHINVSAVDDDILNGLRAISSMGPIAQELLHYLPIMKELQEWKDHHHECSSLTSHVKSVQQTLIDVEEELEMSQLTFKRDVRKQKLSLQQQQKAKEQLESLKEEISSLRESVEESLQTIARFPAEVHEHYLREAEAALIPSSETSDPISHVEKKLIHCGKLLYNKDYNNMEALDQNSTVMKALSIRKGHEEVILKRLPFNSASQQRMAWNELDHLLTLQNRPYVIELNGAFFQKTPYGHDLILEMPYCPNGNLMHWLKKQEYDLLSYDARSIRELGTKRTHHDILLMFLQIAEAVGEIHSLGIEHRDLKPENILIEGTESLARVKLIDFGIGKDSNISFSTTMKTASGVNVQMTTRYAPPERKYSSHQPNNSDSFQEGSWDMYSLGLILYEMLCAPSDAGSIDTLSETNCDASQILASQSGLVDEWSYNLVKDLLSKDPSTRLSASKLCLLVKQKIFDTHSEMQRRTEKRRRSARHQLLQSIQSSIDNRNPQRFAINRSNMMKDTLEYFSKLDSRRKLLQNHMAHYKNESGVGSGVLRDLCTQITNQLQRSTEGVLLENDGQNGWQFYSPVDSRDVSKEMEAFGRLAFYCVARNYTLRLGLSPLVYCALVDHIPTTASGWLDILRAYDSSVSHIEKYLQSLSSSDREMATSQVEAKKKALIGNENRMSNIQSFCRGFTSCMTSTEMEKLSNLSWRDAQLLCSGSEVISPNTVLQVMEVSLNSSRWSESPAHSQTATWFKEWIRDQDSDGLRLFLGFSTGLNSLPVSLRDYAVKVIPCSLYVSAATCYNEVRVGVGCKSKEDFFSMMNQVMEQYDVEGQRQLED